MLGALGGLLALLGSLWFGYGLYVEHVVARSPSTISAIKTEAGELRLGAYVEGNQVVASEAELPRSSPSPAAWLAPEGEGAGLLDAPDTTATPGPSRPILPPTRLRIPKIGVDAPVVLADNDNLPKFKGIGWYVGTGYPGFRGNVVLFGHLNGQYETFGRLDELRPGDEVIVEAMDLTYVYVVTGSKVVPQDAVEVMAPTPDSRLTLITCTGTFYPATRNYSHRLVVVATLHEDGTDGQGLGAEDWGSGNEDRG